MSTALAPTWSARLSQPITLKNGAELRTLADARTCLIENFSNVTRSHALAHAVELLLTAAETRSPKDREAATGQVRIVLRSRGLLK